LRQFHVIDSRRRVPMAAMQCFDAGILFGRPCRVVSERSAFGGNVLPEGWTYVTSATASDRTTIRNRSGGQATAKAVTTSSRHSGAIAE
jgi:hypothetical protein